MAVLNACHIIQQRLQPVRHSLPPSATWADVVNAAYKAQVNLAVQGFYASPFGGVFDWDLQTDDNSERGDLFNYYVFGVAAAEVEVDTLTGLFDVLRADVLMDCGHSLNPAIDIGQVEGAFVQGMGRWTMEAMVWGDPVNFPGIQPGVLHSDGPHSYLIPTPADVPTDFRVSLYDHADSGDASPCPTAIHSSKVSIATRVHTIRSSPLIAAISRVGCGRATLLPLLCRLLRHQGCSLCGQRWTYPGRNGRCSRRIACTSDG
jgi:xanthine dehydrogenase/oxidase